MPEFPSSQRVLAALDRRAARWVRARHGARGADVVEDHIVLHSTVGYRLDTWICRPADPGPDPLPAVVLCPGIDDDARVFAPGGSAPITAEEVARLGYVVLRFDPAGRGSSWGEEDFGGPEHQDDVACAVALLAGRPDVDADRIGLVAISLGVSMAVGAAARAGAPVAWILDWEGPSDREIITAGGTILTPADGHSLDDELYWRPREAVRHVGALRCGYLRLQAAQDHAQPGEVRHAMRMIRAAGDGALPWLQINDHPRDHVPVRANWLPSGTLAANRAISRKLHLLRAKRKTT